jgi:hypothetical protein
MGLVMLRIALVTVLAGVLDAPAIAQECNPVIDGTYCATQVIRKRDDSASPGSKFAPIQGIGRGMVSRPWDQPGTLGAITFRGSETCIGLFRRGACG